MEKIYIVYRSPVKTSKNIINWSKKILLSIQKVINWLEEQKAGKEDYLRFVKKKKKI